ncbi:MAG TPA: N-6 DNA methylase [Fimbriiglobus sp.]|nr:N-6 DNA methylase [Fimbriiglobus sp.]
MNFLASQTPRKLRGGYYTTPDVAVFLAGWVAEAKPRRILEPSCGDGAFLDALAKVGCAKIESITAIEIDPAEAAKAKARGIPSKVHSEDFLAWFLRRRTRQPEFDAVLGNPPFVRYQYLDAGTQKRSEAVFREFGLEFTRHTNAWVPFVVASLAMLRPGGRLAMVVPSELLHVLHARSLRRFLLQQCSRVLVIDPDDIWFDDTLQGVVLLLAEKRSGPVGRLADVAIRRVKDRTALATTASEYFRGADFFPGSVLNGKWMLGLLTGAERALFARLGAQTGVRRFAEVAAVDVGIVTGANRFFLVPDAVVDEYGLRRWAHPMFGRSEHVRGVVYDRAAHEENRRLGLPTNFLWFGDLPLEKMPPSVRQYIRSGEAEDLPSRYKCRIRSPWYNVPSVSLAPVGMLKRSHHFPRLVLNRANAYTTDTAYRITPNGVRAADLVVGFVNSLTALSAELEGRHYGGGVLELVPSEIEKVLVPVGRYSPIALNTLDRSVRAGVSAAELLARQDELVLNPLGIEPKYCETLTAAWLRLRDRRWRGGRGTDQS